MQKLAYVYVVNAVSASFAYRGKGISTAYRSVQGRALRYQTLCSMKTKKEAAQRFKKKSIVVGTRSLRCVGRFSNHRPVLELEGFNRGLFPPGVRLCRWCRHRVSFHLFRCSAAAQSENTPVHAVSQSSYEQIYVGLRWLLLTALQQGCR